MEYQREDEGLQSLTGTVERVVFRNEENGWTVLELEAEDELHKDVYKRQLQWRGLLDRSPGPSPLHRGAVHRYPGGGLRCVHGPG